MKKWIYKNISPFIISTSTQNMSSAQHTSSLNIKGGVIDLKTGVFRPRTPQDDSSYELNINWLGLDIDTTIIDQYISEIMLGDPQMIDFMHIMLGCFITDSTCIGNRFFIFHGDASSGKTVLMTLMAAVLENLYYRAPSSLIVRPARPPRADAPNIDLMNLEHKRLCSVDEIGPDEHLLEGRIKFLTKDSPIVGRKPYHHPHSFTPTHKLVLITNRIPEMDMDYALEYRLTIIPFLAKFVECPVGSSPNERLRDPHKRPTLIAQKDVFFIWLVRGAMKFFQSGFPPMPALMAEYKKAYCAANGYILN